MASRTHRTPPMRRATTVCVVAALVTAGLAPVPLSAQTSHPSPTVTTPWDGTVVVGLLSGHPEPPSDRGYADDWFNAAAVGGIFGRHLTPHVKAELELSTTSQG